VEEPVYCKECGDELFGIEISIGYCSICMAGGDHKDDNGEDIERRD